MRNAKHEEGEVQRALAMWCVVMMVSLASGLTVVRWDATQDHQSFIGTTPDASDQAEPQPPTF
jgi:hypothetical protein